MSTDNTGQDNTGQDDTGQDNADQDNADQDDAGQDDVAGHFQLPPEIFDDDAIRAVRPQIPAAPSVETAENDDDGDRHHVSTV